MRIISLKTKISLAVSGLFILFSVGLSWQTLSCFESELKNSIFNQQSALATSLANGIDDKLAIAHQALISTAATIELPSLPDVDRCQHLLDNSAALHSLFDNGVYLFSLQGRMIVESPFLSPASRGRDISTREYFQTTVATGKPTISSVYISRHTPDHLAIMLTAPIVDKEGRLVAILGGSFDIQGNNIIRSLDVVKVGQTGYVYLIDNNRTLLVHPDRKRIKERVKPGLNRMLDRALAGFEGSGETINSRDVHQIASFRHLRTTDWILGVAYPTAEAYAPLEQMKRNLIMETLAGTSIVLLLIWLLMKRMTLQLTSITQQVAAFSENRGERKRIEMVDTGDEIGALAQTFNNMLGTLAKKRQALEESEARFRSIFEAAAAVMVLLTPDGHFLQVNRAACSFFGYSEEEIRQRTLEDLTHPDDRERTRSIHQRLAAAGEPAHYEKRYLRKDGKIVWGYVSLAVVNDPESQPHYYVGMVQDLTGYKYFEEELQSRERQYRDLSGEFQTLLDGIPDRIIHLSAQLTVIWANQAGSKYLGYESKGLPCYTLLHNRPTPCGRCPSVRAFTSGENEEDLMLDREGRHWGVKAFPLKDRQGKVVSVINYATDITEKMTLRAAAAQAQHLAALGELSAGVAHEINNPNGVILLNAAFLKRVYQDITPYIKAQVRCQRPLLLAGMEVDEVLREVPLLLSEVHDCARRIQRIVDGLKEFVRIPVSDLEPVDLNSVVASAIRVTAPEIEIATAHFALTYGAGGQAVQGNSQAIEQVVINLLTNACQALPDRERGLWVSTCFHSETGEAQVEVRDAGSGILPKNLPHITDPFFTTKRQSGGTGLGLSISSRLVKECGGRLQFYSVPDVGTTVTVILPLWKAKD